jgi:hypothetical protein
MRPCPARILKSAYATRYTHYGPDSAPTNVIHFTIGAKNLPGDRHVGSANRLLGG